MARLDVTQTQNEAAGAALRRWRTRGKLTLEDLAAKLAVKTDGRLPSSSLVAKWERGVCRPGDGYFVALAQVGAPVDGWRGADRDVSPEQLPSASPAIDQAQLEVQRMLEEGRPLAEVYARASRAIGLTLGGGLSPDRQRAWQMLLRTLREGAQERGRIPPLEEHPDWQRAVEIVLDGVSAIPGGPEAVLEAVRRAGRGSAPRVRRAAA